MRVVFLSSASVPVERLNAAQNRWFLPAEKRLEASGVVVDRVTGGPMAAAQSWSRDIRKFDVVRHPIANAGCPHMHEADIAAVAVACPLTEANVVDFVELPPRVRETVQRVTGPPGS